jgi:hypothetical protein
MANFLGANDNLSLEGSQLTAFSNRRMHLRYEVEKEIEYCVHDYAAQIFKGILINISDSGIGMFVFAPLHEGQEITIKSDDKKLNRRASVSWNREVGDNIYKVGLEFIVR